MNEFSSEDRNTTYNLPDDGGKLISVGEVDLKDWRQYQFITLDHGSMYQSYELKDIEAIHFCIKDIKISIPDVPERKK